MSNLSYIKLKEKIAKLEHDLNTLCNHPDSFEASLIKSRRTFRNDIDKACIEHPKIVNRK